MHAVAVQARVVCVTWQNVMAEPPRKIARLQLLRAKLPYVSHSALSAILKESKAEPLPDACSRSSIARSRDAGVKQSTPYGTLHQTVSLHRTDGTNQDVEVQHPFAIMYHLVTTCVAYARLVQRVVAEHPPTPHNPWSLVLYTDEILPGNQLAYKGARKMWGWYWNILQFGSASLSDEVKG